MHLSELADVGPFFALRTGAVPPDAAAGRLPLGPDAVRARVAVVGERLGTAETRVAASVAFQGIAGRLLSIVLGSAVLTGRVPDLAAGDLRWSPVAGAPDDLWSPSPAALPPGAEGRVLRELLVPLHDATREVASVSSRILWGNAGSALAGSLRVLHGWCLARGRDADAERAVDVARDLLADPLLRDTGVLRTRGAGGPTFLRRTCCLYYRVPGGGLCGDCVLRHPPRQSARRRAGGH